jgi:small ligand-binding sensory domain FIST
VARRFAAALSEHPLPTHAVGELVGQVLDDLEGEPDVAVLFVGAPVGAAPSVEAVSDIAAAIRSLLRPGVLVGCTASGVIAGPREVEDRPALALWAARTGPVTPLRLRADGAGDGAPDPTGIPDAVTGPRRTAVLLVDPFSLDPDATVEALGRPAPGPGLSVVGGLASAAAVPGGNRLLLEDAVHTDGAVGFVLPASVEATTLVSQGCRPVGSPLTVTGAAGNVLLELAGRPATQRLAEVLEAASPDERASLTRGVQLGIVVDERLMEFGRGDFLVRSVLGADRRSGGIVVGETIEVGTTVQFHARDAGAATEDLDGMVAGQRAEAALLFTCTGRGERLFGVPGHDASRVHEGTGSTATAGMFCAGELGPVGARNVLHAFTASALLLG